MELIPTRGWGSGRSLQRQINRLFDGFFTDTGFPTVWGREAWAPALDVAETEEHVTVTAEIPGIDPKELSVTVTGDVLTIEGEKRSEREDEGKSLHLVERTYGSFRRSISLPSTVDSSRVEASGKDGILTVRLAKREETKPKTIDVTVS